MLLPWCAASPQARGSRAMQPWTNTSKTLSQNKPFYFISWWSLLYVAVMESQLTHSLTICQASVKAKSAEKARLGRVNSLLTPHSCPQPCMSTWAVLHPHHPLIVPQQIPKKMPLLIFRFSFQYLTMGKCKSTLVMYCFISFILSAEFKVLCMVGRYSTTWTKLPVWPNFKRPQRQNI
jgi:hypothetical protein